MKRRIQSTKTDNEGAKGPNPDVVARMFARMADYYDEVARGERVPLTEQLLQKREQAKQAQYARVKARKQKRKAGQG